MNKIKPYLIAFADFLRTPTGINFVFFAAGFALGAILL